MKARSLSPACALALGAAAFAVPACHSAARPQASSAAEPPAASSSVPAGTIAATADLASPQPGTGQKPIDEPKAASAITNAYLGVRDDPSDGDPEIIGIDHDQRLVWVRRHRDGDRVQIDTVDLRVRKIVETWSSDPTKRLELTGFKRLAFQTLSGSLADDLVRYARIVAANDERTLEVPAMSVSVDRSKIAFLVKSGPRLQVAIADGEGKNVKRVGSPTMRGEHPSVSPDGHWVAFSACEKTAQNNDCPRALYVADLQDPRLTPRKLPVAWPAVVAWDADSKGLATTEAIALARATGVKDLRRSCLLHVTIEPAEARPIVCADDAYDTQLAVSPNRQRAAFVVSRGEPPRRAFDIRSCSLGKGECGTPLTIRQLVDDAQITDEGVVHAAAMRGIPWSMRFEPREEIVFGEAGWVRGAHRLDDHTFARIGLFDKGYAIRLLSGTAPLPPPTTREAR